MEQIIIRISLNIYFLLKFLYNIEYRIYNLYIDNEEALYIKENKKRKFRFSCSNYILDNDYHLCFTKLKKEIKNKNKKTSDTNRHRKKF